MPTDTLRTRIAAAIAKADQDWCSDNNLHDDMADAVIRELNLDISHYYKTSQGREVCIEGFWTEEAADA